MNIDTAYFDLLSYLEQWEIRRKRVQAVRWLPRAILTGLIATAFVAALARLTPLVTRSELLIIALVLILTGPILVITFARLGKRPISAQARTADLSFELRERVSTAVEIKQGRITTSPALEEMQLADALVAAGAVNISERLPFSVDKRDLVLIAITLLLLTAAFVLPNFQERILEEERAVQAAIEEQKEALASLEEAIQENPLISEEDRQSLSSPIASAQEDLETGNLSREQAVAVLSEAEADLRELGENTFSEELATRLGQAGENLTNDESGRELGQALQEGNLAAASRATSRLADDLSSLSGSERRSLAEDLLATAASLENIDPELADELRRAGQALMAEDIEAAQQALRETAATFERRSQQQAASQQAASAADRLDQSREAVAQAGQSDQPGQSQDQGQEAAQGQSQGSGQGQTGQGQTGPGSDQSANSGQGQASDAGSLQSGEEAGLGSSPGPGGGHVENVFVPEFVDLSQEQGVDIELPAECITNPENCGALINETPTEFGDESSLIPYDQVFGDYRDAAYQALEAEYVPLGLRDAIREYFTNLEP